MKECPLCLDSNTQLFFTKKKSEKNYWQCQVCQMIHLDKEYILNSAEEFEHYQTHNNDIHDPRYQKFVSDITDYVQEKISSSAIGLDFGAGPGPVITHVLEKSGYRVEVYDPFFNPQDEVLKSRYDFIVSCEVIEHFNNPAKEFSTLSNLLNEGAALILKSHFYKNDIHFPSWYYHADPTHICFYQEETFHWIKEKYQFKSVEILSDRLCVLWK